MNFKDKHSHDNKEECEIKDSCKNSEKEKDKEVKSECESLKKELKEAKELLLRTAAEYDNFRKRSEREKEAIYSDASSIAILSILPLADSLDAAEKAASSGSDDYKKGIELIKNQLNSALKGMNVEAFGEIGEEFDPNLHNAIAHKESEEERENFLSEIYQKGYKTGSKIIRHAMVEVTN